MLGAGDAVHDDLGQDQRADRRLVLHPAGDSHDDDVIDRHRVEERLRATGGEVDAHPGDDADHLAAVQRSRVDGDVAHLRLGERQLLDQRCELHRHGADERDPGIVRESHAVSLPTLAPAAIGVGVAAAVGTRRRDVERRVAVEEADGREQESRVLHGHDRPVLGPDEVGDAERVPEHDVGVGRRGRSADVHAREPVATCVLVGVLARGASFVAPVRRDPQVVAREPGTPADARLG